MELGRQGKERKETQFIKRGRSLRTGTEKENPIPSNLIQSMWWLFHRSTAELIALVAHTLHVTYCLWANIPRLLKTAAMKPKRPIKLANLHKNIWIDEREWRKLASDNVVAVPRARQSASACAWCLLTAAAHRHGSGESDGARRSCWSRRRWQRCA